MLRGPGVPSISVYDPPPTVANLCPAAGSAIVFTECLRHGIRRWEGETPRLTVFQRYKADWPHSSFEGDTFAPHNARLPPALQVLHASSAPGPRL